MTSATSLVRREIIITVDQYGIHKGCVALLQRIKFVLTDQNTDRHPSKMCQLVSTPSSRSLGKGTCESESFVKAALKVYKRGTTFYRRYMKGTKGI